MLLVIALCIEDFFRIVDSLPSPSRATSHSGNSLGTRHCRHRGILSWVNVNRFSSANREFVAWAGVLEILHEWHVGIVIRMA